MFRIKPGSAILVAVVAYFAFQFGLLDKALEVGKEKINEAGAVPAQIADARDLKAAGIQLDKLRVASAGSMSGYDRDAFRHWSDLDGNGCDQREDTLKRDGERVTTGSGCKITSGRWTDPYGGSQISEAGELDIDHIVPLANAWRSGAPGWSEDKREQFANDPVNLLAVDNGLNRQKGDKGPEAWMPPTEDYRATYAAMWIRVKHKYDLSVTPAEAAALAKALGEGR